MRGHLRSTLWLLLLLRAAGAEQAGPRVRVPPSAMRHEQGHCYIAQMDFGEAGDKFTGNTSGLLLFEDGRPLGPPRSLHRDIRELGGGRYSHWTREALYFSASDNSDPRVNGRRYEVASTNSESTLGGRLPGVGPPRAHTEQITSRRHEYMILMGGKVDMDNSTTVASGLYQVAFQPNLRLTIANIGDVPVINPRLVINDRGNWYTFEDLLAEWTRGAVTPQERIYLIWENMRRHTYHDTPLFADETPHDPVVLYNVFGFNLCDDAGNAACPLFNAAGVGPAKNRALHGHVQCEAKLDGEYQFMDVDMDAFYLDRENERPVSGDACARDHDLVRRELNYGPVVAGFAPSDAPAALFGADDGAAYPDRKGHAIAYTLRPGERVEFRWDNIGKIACESDQWRHLPKYFGNSRFVYEPRLNTAALGADAVGQVSIADDPAGGLVGRSGEAQVTWAVEVPYIICGGTLRLRVERGPAAVALSFDGERWQELWQGEGEVDIALDEALDVFRKPAKYRFRLRVKLPPPARLTALTIETDVMAAPVSLPRLRCGENRVVYRDESPPERRVSVTHEWQECNAIEPLAPPVAPEAPMPGAEVRTSIVHYRWPAVEGARKYWLQVSRRPDFAWPYRPSLDVIIPTTTYAVPFTGIYSPGVIYYGRLRAQDRWGVWGPWSEPWTFTWRGPCVPVNVRLEREGRRLSLHWDANPRGERPVRYEVYADDEKGFSVQRTEYEGYTRGRLPANLLAETADTSLAVVTPEPALPNQNRVFYRVVAVDAAGVSSGCSDYAEAPHPFIWTEPPTVARVGERYRYEARSLRSLGDVQHRYDPPGDQLWDREELVWELIAGPPWLSIDPASGILSGTPTEQDRGRSTVRLKVITQHGGSDEQEYELDVP